MNKDPRDEALDNIQALTDALLARADLPEDAYEDLRIIEAIARHRDLSAMNVHNASERLAEIREINETEIVPDEV